MKHRRLIAGLLIVCALLAGREWLRMPDGKLHAYFLSIGQGDAALLVLPSGEQILIDGGEDWTTLEKLGKYMPFFDRTIELMILSHSDTDHITALVEVSKRYRVRAVMLTGFESTARADEMRAHLQKQGTTVLPAHAGKRVEIGGVVIDVLWPPSVLPSALGKKPNNTSVVATVEYGGKRMLFTGDIEEIVEETLVRTRADLRTDILKVAHHGSRTSSSEVFLEKAQPSIAVISSGEDNRHGHPHQEVLDRFKKIGVEVRRTDKEGDIEVVW